MEPSRTKSDSARIQPTNSLFFALGLLTGIATSAVFALGVWVVSKADRQPVAQGAPTRSPAAAPAGPGVEPVKTVRAEPMRPAEPSPPLSPEPARDEKVVRGPIRQPVPAIVAKPAAPATMPERFVLRDPPPQQVRSFVLPKDAWFALGEVSAEEPDAAEPVVCRADRSLGTALTWAKSPAEASERAAREGKLVFLIHVSGNFEDPGFT